MKHLLSIALALSIFAASCDAKMDFGAISQQKESTSEVFQQPETIKNDPIPVEATLAHGLSLNAMTSFVIDIDGCVTSHRTQLTQNHPSATLIPGDHSCMAKLTSLTINGVSYKSQIASPYFSQGQELIYEGEDDSLLLVTVVMQLPEVIQLPKNENCLYVEFRYNGISRGDLGDIITGVGANGKVLGDTGSFFELLDARFISVVKTGAEAGHGIFNFKLECLAGDTYEECLSLLDSGQLHYELIKDVYGSNMTLMDAIALGSFTLRPIVRDGAIIFTTDHLIGPGVLELAANRKMILIFKIGKSYQYFPINLILKDSDVEIPDTPSQSGEQSQSDDTAQSESPSQSQSPSQSRDIGQE